MKQVSHDTPTSASIAAARDHQRSERKRVEAATGLRIVDPPRPKPFKAACGLCNYTAHAKRDGQAVNSVAAHIIKVHFPKSLPVEGTKE